MDMFLDHMVHKQALGKMTPAEKKGEEAPAGTEKKE
jgi:hypothetical protein